MYQIHEAPAILPQRIPASSNGPWTVSKFPWNGLVDNLVWVQDIPSSNDNNSRSENAKRHLSYTSDYCQPSHSSSGSSSTYQTIDCVNTSTNGMVNQANPVCYEPVKNSNNNMSRYQYDSDYNAIITRTCNNHSIPGNSAKDTTPGSANKIDKKDEISFAYPIISMLTSTINISVDLTLSYLLYKESQHLWFTITTGLLIIPSILVNIFSIKWYIQDYRQSKIEPCIPKRPKLTSFQWIIKIFAHILLIGHIFRYFDLLFFAYKSYSLKRQEESKKYKEDFYLSILQQTTNLAPNLINDKPIKENNEGSEYINYYLLTINEDRDTALLSLIKSFSQSTPIIILQTYIISSGTDFSLQRTIVMVQIASIVTSLVDISWSLASYHRALRQSIPDKRNMSFIGVILSFFWRLFTLTSRLLSIGLFLSAFSYWILPITIGHWGIMTVWVMHQGTHFCSNEQSEYLFNMILGTLYLFEFLNIKDEPTRYKYTAYYAICLIENLVLSGLWYLKVTQSESTVIHRLTAFSITSGLASAFALGILFMLIYYRFAHPNGKPLWVNKAAKCC